LVIDVQELQGPMLVSVDGALVLQQEVRAALTGLVASVRVRPKGWPLR
jgi:hypothetical protein